MAVNLSPVGGVAAQFFTNNGTPLTGGKLYTYSAGSTTPAATFTSSNGSTAWTNPIVLDAAGRVSGSGEIWLTDGIIYKFILKDSNDVLIATYDNITGINSNSVAFVNQQEIVTATAGQTVFNLGINYQPATNSLSVFVDGVNQYGPGALYAYVETDSNTVTFTSGLHVGAEVKFTTTQQQSAGAVDASQVTYEPPFTGFVATNVEAKLAQTISVLDFGAVGDGVADDTAAIQAAIAFALSQYSRSANGIFGYWPTRAITVLFPTGIYNVGSTLTPNNASYAVCNLVGEGTATIRYTGAGACIYTNPIDPGLPLMSSPVQIKNLHIWKDNKSAGSVGLVVERMTNCLFENVSFYGFDYAIQILGAIDCEFDFKGAMLENCNVGILIQQKSGTWGIMKPNLTTIRNAYFVNCSSNAIIIRRNPDESAVNNGSGGVISIADCNFQNNSSGPTVLIQSPGEVPGKGTVNLIRCWFEGHGNTALTVIDGKATMENCFIMNGLDPILLGDNTSKLVLDELGCFFSVSPTSNAVIKRLDATSNGIEDQVNTRNVVITVDGIGGVLLGPSNKIALNSLNLDVLKTALARTTYGTASLAGSGGFADIVNLTDGGTFIFAVKESGGGIAWSGQFTVVSSGIAINVTTLSAANITMTGSGSNVRLTNTNALAIDLQWSAIRIG